VIDARVWFSAGSAPLLGLDGLMQPSDQRRPGMVRPVNSSTMMIWPSRTM
jgi:hypothetical protein